MYIYKWTHKDSGRVYIGQTIQDPNRRRLEHISQSYGSPYSYHFHNALKKYGLDRFDWEVIDQANSIDDLNKLEEKYIEIYDSINNGFNIRNGGRNKTYSEESKKRMSEAQKKAHARRRLNKTEGGWKHKTGGPMKGKIPSVDHKKKIAESNRLYHEERRSRGDLTYWEINESPLKGKTWKLIHGKRVWMEV